MGGHWVNCKKCKKVVRVDKDDLENIGTLWHQIWKMECPICGSTIIDDWGNYKSFAEFLNTGGRKPDAYERAESGDIREYWIQGYVKENYKKLGFSEIRGPFEAGPDFKGIYKGEGVAIEVERTRNSFVEHGHHKNHRFKDVSVLVVLSHAEPLTEFKKYLPEIVIQIDISDFIKWWRLRAKEYAEEKRAERIIHLIASEFHSRFLTICSSKDEDREMSTCPDCELCAYFDEEVEGVGRYNLDASFVDLALEFIAYHDYQIASDDFYITDIHPYEIDKFFYEFFGYTVSE